MTRTSRLHRALIAAAVLLVPLAAQAETVQFKRVATQYIAATAAPDAKSGGGAEAWGYWPVDPGPRGVWLASYDKLVARDGAAPAGWQFDNNDWWLEEHGLLMETPDFPMPAGKSSSQAIGKPRQSSRSIPQMRRAIRRGNSRTAQRSTTSLTCAAVRPAIR